MIVFSLSVSCTHDEKDDPEPGGRLTYIYEFPQYTVTENSGSPIEFDNPTHSVCFIINNYDELHALVPAEVIAADPAYSAIDFSSQTLVSVRFSTFFDLDSIGYELFMFGEDLLGISIRITQSSYDVSTKYYHKGNFLVRKIPSGTRYSILFG